MDQPECMKIHKDNISQDIMDKYDAHSILDSSNYVYFQINKGMYGLKQTSIFAHKQLKENLAHHGYYPIPHPVGMWKHQTRKTLFCLCVDDFGIQYDTQADADHLIHALKQNYKITVDLEGHNYCGLQLNWNYKDQYLDICQEILTASWSDFNINNQNIQLMPLINGTNLRTRKQPNITFHLIILLG